MNKHSISFTDDHIINAYQQVSDKIKHTDAPTEADLILIRDRIVPFDNNELVSLHWLRNRLVRLRKAGKFKELIAS